MLETVTLNCCYRYTECSGIKDGITDIRDSLSIDVIDSEMLTSVRDSDGDSILDNDCRLVLLSIVVRYSEC